MSFFKYIEIIGPIVSVIGGYLTYLRKDENTRLQFGLIGALLGIVISLLLSIRFEYMEKILENNILEKDPLAYNLAIELSQTHENVENSNNKISKDIFDARLKEFKRYLNDAKSGKFTIQNTDFDDFAIKIFDYAGSNTKIIATSYVEPSDWWKTTWGENYLKKNYEAVNIRHCTIERVYIFKDEAEFQSAKEEMDRQKKNNINIYYAMASDLTANNSHELKQDMIIVGDVFCGKLYLTDERKPTHADFSTNREDIETMKSNFEKLRNYIKRY